MICQFDTFAPLSPWTTENPFALCFPFGLFQFFPILIDLEA